MKKGRNTFNFADEDDIPNPESLFIANALAIHDVIVSGALAENLAWPSELKQKINTLI